MNKKDWNDIDIEIKSEGTHNMIGDIPESIYKFGWIIITAIILIVISVLFMVKIPYTEDKNLWEVIVDGTYLKNQNGIDSEV